MFGFLAFCVMLAPIVLMAWFGFRGRSRGSGMEQAMDQRGITEPTYTPPSTYVGGYDLVSGNGDSFGTVDGGGT